MDDEPRVLASHRRALRNHYEVDVAKSGAEALAKLDVNGPYAVIVSDMRMPEMNGVELLALVKERAPQTVRMMLTGNSDQNTAIEAVNKGDVYRFLTKPCSRTVMRQMLDDAIAVFEESRDRDEQFEQNAARATKMSSALSRQARRDVLTGCANRSTLQEHAERLLTDEHLRTSVHALLFLDIDQFRVVNTEGYIVGDDYLRNVAMLIDDSAAPSHMLCRLGADKFALFMEHTSLDVASRIAAELCVKIAALTLGWNSHASSLTVSIGVTQCQAGIGEFAPLLCRAEMACSIAKDRGGNQAYAATADDPDVAKRSADLHWRGQIVDALEQNRFRVYAQPIAPISQPDSGAHYETLIRMLDEHDQIIEPGHFLPAAEIYNLAGKVDRWMVSAVLSWLANEPAHVATLDLCSINLSGQSLGDADCLSFIVDEFRRSKIPPEKICFEITETSAVADMRNAIAFINALKTLGCRFALDDFGIGFSSFAYLSALPVDFVKIDGSFIRDMTKDEISDGMVKAINEIAHLAGKETIAEFVNGRDVIDRLTALGVDYIQGYGVGRPVPIDELKAIAHLEETCRQQ